MPIKNCENLNKHMLNALFEKLCASPLIGDCPDRCSQCIVYKVKAAAHEALKKEQQKRRS